MPEVFRERGFKFYIYFNDHDPPHCHVYKGGNDAEIRMAPLEVLDNHGFNPREIGRILKITGQRQDELLQAWHSSRP